MPFIAKSKTTGDRVDITRFASPRLELNASDIICQLCGAPMIIRSGKIVRPHFAHKNECSSDYQSHPESPEHLLAKLIISEKIKAEWKEYGDAKVEFEYPVPEVKRIIDIAMLFPMGWIVAHEIQLSSITTEQLENRTKDYRNAGIDVVWWLGKSADTPANRSWCVENFGVCFTLNYQALVEHNKL